MINFFNFAVRPELESQIRLNTPNECADALKKLIDENGSVFCFAGDDEKLTIISKYVDREDENDDDIFISDLEDTDTGRMYKSFTVKELTPIIE